MKWVGRRASEAGKVRKKEANGKEELGRIRQRE